MKSALAFLAVLAVTLALPIQAQSPSGFVASSDAMALHGPSGWGVGNLTTESYDFLDYGTTKSNRVFLQGVELSAPSTGLSVFGGGVLWQPDISALLKKTNLPAGNFLTFVDASAGAGIPQTGTTRVSAIVGGGVRYILSDNLTWNTVRFEEVFFGNQRYPAISMGIAGYFGGTPASATASSNVRRSLLKRVATAAAKLSAR